MNGIYHQLDAFITSWLPRLRRWMCRMRSSKSSMKLRGPCWALCQCEHMCYMSLLRHCCMHIGNVLPDVRRTRWQVCPCMSPLICMKARRPAALLVAPLHVSGSCVVSMSGIMPPGYMPQPDARLFGCVDLPKRSTTMNHITMSVHNVDKPDLETSYQNKLTQC